MLKENVSVMAQERRAGPEDVPRLPRSEGDAGEGVGVNNPNEGVATRERLPMGSGRRGGGKEAKLSRLFTGSSGPAAGSAFRPCLVWVVIVGNAITGAH